MDVWKYCLFLVILLMYYSKPWSFTTLVAYCCPDTPKPKSGVGNKFYTAYNIREPQGKFLVFDFSPKKKKCHRGFSYWSTLFSIAAGS